MAELQKQVNVNPTIASVGDPLPPDTGTADAIRSVGGAVRSFVLEKKKEKFMEELGELGNPSSVRAISDNFLAGKKEFDRLKRGLAQGALTQTHVNIATEALLKEAIGATPALAPELRKYAAEQLGFDPTGSHVRALLDQSIPDKKEENPVLKQFRNTAEALNAINGTPIEASMKLQGKILAAKTNGDLIAANAVIGAAGRTDIFNVTLTEHDGFVADTMKDIVFNVQAGGVSDPEVVKGLVQQNMMAQKSLLRSRYVEAGIPADSQELARDFAQIDEQWKPVQELVEDGSFEEIVTRNAKELTQLMTIQGMNVMGDVAMMNQIGGQEAVKHYFTTLEKYGKKDQFELLKRNNPVLARYAGSLDDMTKLAAEAYRKVMGRSPMFSTDSRFGSVTLRNPQHDEVVNSVADRIAGDLINNPGTDEERDALLDYARSHGQRFKMLGAYAKKGAYVNSSEDEKRWVADRFEQDFPELVNRVSAELTDPRFKDVTVGLDRSGQLSIIGPQIDPQGRTGLMGEPYREQNYVSTQLQGDLKRLQVFIDAAKNGWSTDFGVEPQALIQDTIATISVQSRAQPKNQEALNKALETYEDNPTPENLEAIRAIDPDLVTSVESSGGTNSAK